MSTISCLHPGPNGSPDDQDLSHPHVLLVVDGFPTVLGGGERILLKLATLRPSFGYRVSILTLSAHPESPVLLAPPCNHDQLPRNAFRHQEEGDQAMVVASRVQHDQDDDKSDRHEHPA
jgi:hypothetical protein